MLLKTCFCYFKLQHVSNQARKARWHVSTQGTLAREPVSTQDTLAREHVSTQGTLPRNLADSYDNDVTEIKLLEESKIMCSQIFKFCKIGYQGFNQRYCKIICFFEKPWLPLLTNKFKLFTHSVKDVNFNSCF